MTELPKGCLLRIVWHLQLPFSFLPRSVGMRASYVTSIVPFYSKKEIQMSQGFKKEQEEMAGVWVAVAVIYGLIAWPLMSADAAITVFLFFLILGMLWAYVLMPWDEQRKQQGIEKERQQNLEPPKPVFLFSEISETRDGL